jgi:ADP-ribose pyrophosphatase
MYVYLATDLRHNPLEADADEFLTVERFTLSEALAMSERGEIQDAKSLAAILLARKHLELQK